MYPLEALIADPTLPRERIVELCENKYIRFNTIKFWNSVKRDRRFVVYSPIYRFYRFTFGVAR